VLLELRQSRLARERLVVAKECKNDVRFRVRQLEAVLPHRRTGIELGRLWNRRAARQPFVGRAKGHRPQPQRNLVARIAQIAKYQVVLREPADQPRLQPAEILHPLGQRVADDADMVAFFDFQIGSEGKIDKKEKWQAVDEFLHGRYREEEGQQEGGFVLVSLSRRQSSTGWA